MEFRQSESAFSEPFPPSPDSTLLSLGFNQVEIGNRGPWGWPGLGCGVEWSNCSDKGLMWSPLWSLSGGWGRILGFYSSISLLLEIRVCKKWWCKKKRWPELTLLQLCSLGSCFQTYSKWKPYHTKVNVTHVCDLYSLKCLCHSPGQPLQY